MTSSHLLSIIIAVQGVLGIIVTVLLMVAMVKILRRL